MESCSFEVITAESVGACLFAWGSQSFVRACSVEQLQPFLDRVNVATKMPPKSGMSLEAFVREWRTNVEVNLKGSRTPAAESHLRAHIIPKLGSLPLTGINTKTVQSFVAYLATGDGQGRR
jgi:hypothetical protein